MMCEIKKVPATYTDKNTGETKKTWHYYLYAPSGVGIQIRNVFKEDNGKLNLLIPAESESK